MSAILKFDFQKREQLRFFWSKLSKLHKKDSILHVPTTFSPKQGETRTSHGPIPHPLSLKFKINLIFYLIKEFMKHSCLNFFYEIVNKISIKVKRNWNLKNSPSLKDDQFFLTPDFKKILTFMK